METPNNNPASISGKNEAVSEIEALVARARSAQAAIEGYTQEEADALATSVGWQVYKSREALAKLVVEEGALAIFPTRSPRLHSAYLGRWPTWLRSRRVALSRRIRRAVC